MFLYKPFILWTCQNPKSTNPKTSCKVVLRTTVQQPRSPAGYYSPCMHASIYIKIIVLFVTWPVPVVMFSTSAGLPKNFKYVRNCKHLVNDNQQISEHLWDITQWNTQNLLTGRLTNCKRLGMNEKSDEWRMCVVYYHCCNDVACRYRHWWTWQTHSLKTPCVV